MPVGGDGCGGAVGAIVGTSEIEGGTFVQILRSMSVH